MYSYIGTCDSYMLTFTKAMIVIKLCMDKLYVASILRIKVLSTYVMLQELEYIRWVDGEDTVLSH